MESSECLSEVWEVIKVRGWEISAYQRSEGGAGYEETADNVGPVTSGGLDVPVGGMQLGE